MFKAIRVVAVLGLVASACGVGADETDAQAPGMTDETTASQELTGCTDTWMGYAKGFFATNCSTCHAAQFSSKAKVKASGARAAIKSGAMPRGGGLTTTQRKRIEKWFACGLK